MASDPDASGNETGIVLLTIGAEGLTGWAAFEVLFFVFKLWEVTGAVDLASCFEAFVPDGIMLCLVSWDFGVSVVLSEVAVCVGDVGVSASVAGVEGVIISIFPALDFSEGMECVADDVRSFLNRLKPMTVARIMMEDIHHQAKRREDLPVGIASSRAGFIRAQACSGVIL